MGKERSCFISAFTEDLAEQALLASAGLEEGKAKEPLLASECTEVPKAEKWRRQITGEISKKVTHPKCSPEGERTLGIQNKGAGRQKFQSTEVPGDRGCKYFEAAKDLPGVRELFERNPQAKLMKDINTEYCGYRDEDDGILETLEQEHEKKVTAESMEKWKVERDAQLARGEEVHEENINGIHEEGADEEGGKEREGEDGQQKFIAHVPVPTQQQIEEALLQILLFHTARYILIFFEERR
uniref:ISY1 factor n=1 Tax=Junco hyemalis TaxID=40217 RepID=A0A8C5JEV9_JUNHY